MTIKIPSFLGMKISTTIHLSLLFLASFIQLSWADEESVSIILQYESLNFWFIDVIPSVFLEMLLMFFASIMKKI